MEHHTHMFSCSGEHTVRNPTLLCSVAQENTQFNDYYSYFQFLRRTDGMEHHAHVFSSSVRNTTVRNTTLICSVPQYGTPQYGTPQYGTPQYGTPHSYVQLLRRTYSPMIIHILCTVSRSRESCLTRNVRKIKHDKLLDLNRTHLHCLSKRVLLCLVSETALPVFPGPESF